MGMIAYGFCRLTVSIVFAIGHNVDSVEVAVTSEDAFVSELMTLPKVESPRLRLRRLYRFFERSCDDSPHSTALVCGSLRLSYRELEGYANQLARYLVTRGVGPDSCIGILLKRSPDTYVSLLGVLKAGAAFVPLDPSFPKERIAFIAQDAGLTHLITVDNFAGIS